jgi:hypothetical protein
MPVARRIPIDRQLLPFSPEVLDLFRALEKVPRSRRYPDPRSRQLAELLGLMDEYLTVNHVNDTAGQCHPPGYQSHKDWHVCRAVREQLLEAITPAQALSN